MLARLELSLVNVIQRTGLLNFYEFRQVLRHKKILVNGKIVDRAVVLKMGDIVTFRTLDLRKQLLSNFCQTGFIYKS